MSVKESPVIKDYSKGTDYVEIRFIPDYKRFKMTNITDDVFRLF